MSRFDRGLRSIDWRERNFATEIPSLEVFQYRHSASLALGVPLLIGARFDLPFDAEQRFEELDGLVRPTGRFQQLSRFDELTSSVHKASNLVDSAIHVQPVVAGKGIRLQVSPVVLQKVQWRLWLRERENS